MAAILAASRCSQRMPCGRRLRRQLMTSSAAMIRSRRKSWSVSGQRLLQDLQGVDSGGHHGVGADQAGLHQQRELQVGEAVALAHPGALAVDGHAAADHQVHGSQLAQR